MGTTKETFSKREKEKARQKKRQDKQEKRENRKVNGSKGQSLDQMLAYVDENGNLTTTPSSPRNYTSINQEDIVIGVPRSLPSETEEIVRNGTITMFNSAKGYGFIRDHQSQQSIFVHQNELIDPISQNDRVTFEIKNTPKGASAVQVKKLVKPHEIK